MLYLEKLALHNQLVFGPLMTSSSSLLRWYDFCLITGFVLRRPLKLCRPRDYPVELLHKSVQTSVGSKCNVRLERFREHFSANLLLR